jgi:alkanesulfonate monooxygenase SsuD/methylene tetrahydromethanopterin reductase-like flavin-dependent oxidoreductase (luciferase family)
MIAKQGATIDVYSGGCFAINILTGWFKGEYLAFAGLQAPPGDLPGRQDPRQLRQVQRCTGHDAIA